MFLVLLVKLGLLNYPDKGWKNALPWVGLTVFKRALFKINLRLTHSQPCMKTLEKQELKCGSLDGGEFGGGWIHVYVWLSPFAVYLKLSGHC